MATKTRLRLRRWASQLNAAATSQASATQNHVRSTGPALFAGGAYIAQRWLFWLAPILGAVMTGFVARWQHPEKA